MIYPDFTIEPCGSCDKIINDVKSLRQQKKFHHQDVYGLIDKDFRSEGEIRTLRRKGISSIPFREIENVLISKDVIFSAMNNLGYPKADITQKLFEIMNTLRQKLISITSKRANDLSKRAIINFVEDKISSCENLMSSKDFFKNEDLEPIISEIHSNVTRISNSEDWDEILSVFSVRKDDFGSQVAKALDFKDFSVYKSMILRVAEQTNEAGTNLKAAIARKFPRIG